jgi:hypothetical protein
MMLEINVMQCIALVDLSYDFGCCPRLSKVPPPWPAVISSEWRFREMRISKLPCQQGGHFALDPGASPDVVSAPASLCLAANLHK